MENHERKNVQRKNCFFQFFGASDINKARIFQYFFLSIEKTKEL